MSKADIESAVENYVDKMSRPCEPLDLTFVAFVKERLSVEFRSGWDKQWQIQRENFVLPTRSCLEAGRAKGGPRGLDRDALRDEYRRFTNGENISLGRKTKPMMIWTGGKWRLVTKFSARRSFLGPLHRCIYGHLSKKDWLLRGEATKDRFEGFGRVDGEEFVSGDYESATDNLNINLSELILREISKTSRHIPASVWEQAFISLHNEFPDGRMQRRGQLMGSLLSFPLLCISNFLAFKYAIRRRVPIKINGDDIVFRCTPNERIRWFDAIEKSGLVVSKGKTLVSKSVFSLNSTFFSSSVSGVGECPVIRSTCLFGSCEEPSQISGRLKGVYRGGGIVGEYTRSLALREMSKQVYSSQRSLRRGLGATLSWRTIRWAGLEDREFFYNKLLVEKALPPIKKEWMLNAIPDGYERRRVYGPAIDDPEFAQEMIENCWSRPALVGEESTLDEYWRLVREDTFRYVEPIPLNWWVLAGGTGTPDLSCNTKREEGHLVWRKTSGEGVAFCRAGEVAAT